VEGLKSRIQEIENRVVESHPPPPVPNTTLETNGEELSSAPLPLVPATVDEPKNDGLNSSKKLP